MTRLLWRRWDGRHPTGIDRVCLAYLRHYKRNAQAVVQHSRARRILDSEASAMLFDLLEEPDNFRRRIIDQVLRYGFRKSCVGRGRIYLNIGHTGLNDPGLRAWLSETAVRPVYFVHDLIPITHPEFCRNGEREKHLARMRTVLDTAVGVIGNSQATLRDLSGFARSEGTSSPRAIAALLGSDVLPPPRPLPEPKQPTFVVLGTIEARKNHLMLLQIWSRIVRNLGPDAPRLLVLGQRGWECEQVFDLLDRSELLRSAVTEINACDDATLASHLSHARALLFPSLVEGYGLPLVEALQSCTPVLASNLAVFKEIAGDVPDYLDPLDGPAWERAILEYSKHASATRALQITKIATFQPPTWRGHFAIIESWLRTV